MRWAKIVLLFQAVVTLLIGVAFFSQLTSIGTSGISDIKEELTNPQATADDAVAKLDGIRARYTLAAYALLVIGLVEVMIIIRLFS